MLIMRNCVLLAACLLAVFIGCAKTAPPPAEGASAEGEAYLLSSEPAGATDVLKAIENAKADEDVVVVGRVGGEVDPWVEGLAAFSIVDRSLAPCNETKGDECKTPWDYCCEPELATFKTLIKIVDEQGKLVNVDARKLLNLKELQTIVVQGKAARDDAGNLTVLATGIYVRK